MALNVSGSSAADSFWFLWSRIPWWALLLVQVGGAVAAASMTARVNSAGGWGANWPTLVAALCILVIPATSGLDKRYHSWKTTSEDSWIVLLRHYLTPACDEMRRIAAAAPTEANGAMAHLQKSILSAASMLCGPRGSGLRAILFESKGTKMTQALNACGERSDRTFSNDRRDPAGKTAWTNALTCTAHVFNDLSDEAKSPKGYDTTQVRPYRSFMTCGIRRKTGEIVGMINVDSPEVDAFSSVDAVLLQTLADLLAVGYALSARRT